MEDGVPWMSVQEVLGVERIPPTLTVQQAALLLGVSKQTLYRAVDAGELAHLKVRGRVVLAARPILEALELDG